MSKVFSVFALGVVMVVAAMTLQFSLGSTPTMSPTGASASTPAADAALASLKAQVQGAVITDSYYTKAGLLQTLSYAQGQFAQNSNYGNVTGCQGLTTFKAQVALEASYHPSVAAYAPSWIAQTDAIMALVPCS